MGQQPAKERVKAQVQAQVKAQVAIVTGASSGIGRAVAERLGCAGFRVFGTSRKPAVADSALTNTEFVQLDVRDDDSVRSCVKTVLDRAGRIDALVNNAGYTLIGSLEETSLDEAKQLFETNFFGALRMTQAVLPAMRQQGYGRIVNVGSAAGFLPMPYQGIYSATKHALEGYSESLDHEVQQFGIRVSVIEPGFIRTSIDENSQVVSQPLAIYAADRNRLAEILGSKVKNAEGPDRFASLVLTILTSRSPQGTLFRPANQAHQLAPNAGSRSGFRQRAPKTIRTGSIAMKIGTSPRLLRAKRLCARIRAKGNYPDFCSYN